MEEFIEPLEQVAEAVSHKMIEVAKDLHQNFDAESVVDVVLEVGSVVVEAITSD